MNNVQNNILCSADIYKNSKEFIKNPSHCHFNSSLDYSCTALVRIFKRSMPLFDPKKCMNSRNINFCGLFSQMDDDMTQNSVAFHTCENRAVISARFMTSHN